MKNKEYKSFSWIDPWIKIKKSAIEGKGMFAKEIIKKGEIAIVWGGIVVAKEKIKKGLIKVKKYSDVEIDDGIYLIDKQDYQGEVDDSLLNHSCNSNLWMENEITISAKRDIIKGEELTLDYALFSTELDHGLRECNCNSKICRGVFSPNDWMNKELQNRHKNKFSPFINKKIKNINKEAK